MKKFCLFITVFITAAASVCAQNPQTDNVVNALAGDIHRKLVEERATKVVVSNQFTFRGESVPLFVSYWVNQLTGELANIPNKPYILLSGGLADADIGISGEIVETGDIIRVYTRLIRQDNRAIAASFHSDIEMNQEISALFAGGLTYVPPDDYEPDSWENPTAFEIGADENVATEFRTISHNDDEDFFLLQSNRDERVVLETTGGIDTYIEFYDADTKQLLAEDDDSGLNNNAKITYNVETGKRYIVKVRGYSGSATGYYAFRAYFRPPRETDSSWKNPIQYQLGANQNATEVYRILYEDDADFFILVPNNTGRLVMETSGEIDTYMEFYDADTKRLIAENDDGGQGNNAKIIYNFEAGKRYIAKVRGYNSEITGNYAFRAYIIPLREGASSWESPIQYQLGSNRNAAAVTVNRVLVEDDEEFFLIVNNRNSSITMETTGDTDTIIEFYDADTKELLAEDDDSGQDNNAELTYIIDARKRYIVKVRSYGGSPGAFGFRAYIRR